MKDVLLNIGFGHFLVLAAVLFAIGAAGVILRRNLLIYGLGGIIIPFIGIKVIDLIITAVGLA